jgi:hypothetical protein
MNSNFTSSDLEFLRNRTFDEIKVAEAASIHRTLTAGDIQLFAAISGDINPQHIDSQVAHDLAPVQPRTCRGRTDERRMDRAISRARRTPQTFRGPAWFLTQRANIRLDVPTY